MLMTPLLPLSWHPAASALIEDSRAGTESLFLVGPAGVGKSALVQHHAGLPSAAAAATSVGASSPSLPEGGSGTGIGVECDRSILYVLLGRSAEPSTLLGAILEATKQPLSARLRRKGATVILQYTANWLAKLGVGAVALDEVQHASPSALFHALLLADECAREHGHALGLILIGTPDAGPVVRQTGQLGQRLPVELSVPLLGPDEVVAVARAASDEVARLFKELGKRRAESLQRDLVAGVAGSVRRLDRIVRRAVRLAAMDGGRLTEEHVRAALDIQAH